MNQKQFVQAWIGKVSEAALPFEANWTWRALKLEDPELCERLRRQRSAFDRACITRELRDVALIGEATVRGYQLVCEVMRKRQVHVEAVSLAKLGPNLQELVAKHGGYQHITPEAWEEYDRAVVVWRAKIRAGEFDRERDAPPAKEEELQR